MSRRPAATGRFKKEDGPRVLRIGVMQGSRIIEERIIRTRDSVSVGQSARSTFILAHPSLPAHHVLFQSGRDGYVLRSRPFMTGRIATREGPLLLEGESTRVPLDDSSRGKLVFGDVTLLFQFVAPPPVQPRPQLPSSVRGPGGTRPRRCSARARVSSA